MWTMEPGHRRRTWRSGTAGRNQLLKPLPVPGLTPGRRALQARAARRLTPLSEGQVNTGPGSLGPRWGPLCRAKSGGGGGRASSVNTVTLKHASSCKHPHIPWEGASTTTAPHTHRGSDIDIVSTGRAGTQSPFCLYQPDAHHPVPESSWRKSWHETQHQYMTG